jgi:hypothetical protein
MFSFWEMCEFPCFHTHNYFSTYSSPRRRAFREKFNWRSVDQTNYHLSWNPSLSPILIQMNSVHNITHYSFKILFQPIFLILKNKRGLILWITLLPVCVFVCIYPANIWGLWGRLAACVSVYALNFSSFMWYSHLFLDLPSDPFPSGFPSKRFYALLYTQHWH